LVLVVPTLLGAVAISDSVYERAWRTPKGLDGRITVLFLVVVVFLVAGTVVVAMAERSRVARPGSSWPALDGATVEVLKRVYPVLIVLALVGYGIWIGSGIARGLRFQDVQDVLATQDNFKLPVKEKLETLPGLTTLTQVAIPAVVIGIVLDARRPTRWIRWGYRLLIVLAAVRAFLLAERLAVAEILVPVIVVRAALAARRATRRGRALVALAPVFGVALLLVGFAVSEYSRSWNWYSDRTDRSFVDFASERLLGYYATSHNNGALLLEHGEIVGAVPYYTTSFVWEVPPGSQLGGEVADDVGDERRRVLHGFGNPEFNSPGGLASILTDYGVVGGAAFAFGLGLVVGSLHLGFLHGRLVGLLVYPVIYTGLLELPRYLYWFQGRALPALVIPVAVAMVLSVRRRRSARHQALRATMAAGARA
jgi:hypothetical protein